jgi:enoyl-CoA hydratase/carnithine racemase
MAEQAAPDDAIVLVKDTERARLITFNRPRAANAFNQVLYHAAADALRDAADDDSIGAVVLTGSGRSFSAGTDLHEMAANVPDGDDQPTTPSPATGFPAFVDRLSEFPKPILAAVNGSAVGLGFTMLAHCDMVLVSENARLLAPFSAMGVAPEAASSYLLPRRMGRQHAALALFTSDWITPEEAVEQGLAIKVCAADQLVPETMALATRIAAHSLPSLRATKRLLLDAERAGIQRARGLENDAFAELLKLPNAREGVFAQLGGEPKGSKQQAPA